MKGSAGATIFIKVCFLRVEYQFAGATLLKRLARSTIREKYLGARMCEVFFACELSVSLWSGVEWKGLWERHLAGERDACAETPRYHCLHREAPPLPACRYNTPSRH